jgi:glutamate/aspartate transport system substrate-binding protein
LRDKTVVVSAGTTNERAVRALSEKQALPIDVIAQPDLQQAFSVFGSGRAYAFATDEVLLLGFKARNKSGRPLDVVGEFLSFEPYSIVYRRDDPQMARVVDGAFRRLAESRELAWIYDKWFVRRLPGGEQLNLRMNTQLITIFESLGLQP